jgi:SAM-dependent methyltransferase
MTTTTMESDTRSTDRRVGYRSTRLAVKRTIVLAIVRQFGHPRGVAGKAVGWVMGRRTSNRERNLWATSLLDVQPGNRALEVGFGPGVAIAEPARRVGPTGHVSGIDHSEVMLRQATKRNAAAIKAGTVSLAVAAVEQLPAGLDGPFDAILAVNSLGFWIAPVERLADLRRRLRTGGRIAIVSQPRPPRTNRSAAEVARELTSLMEAAGLRETRTEILDLEPPVVCVLAVNG